MKKLQFSIIGLTLTVMALAFSLWIKQTPGPTFEPSPLPVTGSGNGESIQQAKIAALEDLVSRLSISISTKTEKSTEVTKRLKEQFSQDIVISSGAQLYGIEFSTNNVDVSAVTNYIKTGTNSHNVTATIDLIKLAQIYVNRLKQLNLSINQILGEQFAKQDPKSRLRAYPKLSSQLAEYHSINSLTNAITHLSSVDELIDRYNNIPPLNISQNKIDEDIVALKNQIIEDVELAAQLLSTQISPSLEKIYLCPVYHTDGSILNKDHAVYKHLTASVNATLDKDAANYLLVGRAKSTSQTVSEISYYLVPTKVKDKQQDGFDVAAVSIKLPPANWHKPPDTGANQVLLEIKQAFTNDKGININVNDQTSEVAKAKLSKLIWPNQPIEWVERDFCLTESLFSDAEVANYQSVQALVKLDNHTVKRIESGIEGIDPFPYARAQVNFRYIDGKDGTTLAQLQGVGRFTLYADVNESLLKHATGKALENIAKQYKNNL